MSKRSKVVYKGLRPKVIIICHKHGEFEQSPENHTLQKQGCIKCGYESNAGKCLWTQAEFIERANKVHGKYDYSKTVYKNS
jgi:hypothetical protein